MDFLKSCTTNVRVVDSLASIPCEVFILEGTGTETERSSQLYKTIGKLREGNMLCSLNERQLCVFGYKLEGVKASLKDLGYIEAEIEEERKSDILLEAVEGSLAFKLAADGLVHVAPWTWLFFDDDHELDSGDGSTLIELQTKLGSNGALYVTSSTRSSQLLPVLPLAEGDGDVSCLLAPSGKLVKACLNPADADKLTVGNAAWKASVIEVLGAEGGSISGNDQWIQVELNRDEDTSRLLWPRKLCFRSSNKRERDELPLTQNWRQWFNQSIADGDTFREPLASAEDWFTGATQREAASQGEELAPTDSIGPSTLPDATADLVTSPPFNQRTADQQAAMGGIYPTPPDGLLPGTQGTQQIPSSESTTMPAINEASEALPGEEIEGLRQSMSSSNAPEGGFHRSDDDLFGDMGEMDFGGNEVGDADFDYFDEPDEEPEAAQHAHETLTDVEMGDADTSTQTENAQQVVHEPGTDHEVRDQRETDGSGGLQPLALPDDQPAETPVEDGLLATSSEHIQANEIDAKPERPLSPFGIRERLLPPPIPASAMRAESEKGGPHRRTSAFGPVTFNEGLGLAAKYSNDSLMDVTRSSRLQKAETDISLPHKQKKSRVKASSPDPDSPGSEDDSVSSGDSFSESETSVSDTELPRKLPWESRKRKRTVMADADHASDFAWVHGYAEAEREKSELSFEQMRGLRTALLRSECQESSGWSRRRAPSQLDPDLPELWLDDQERTEDDELLPVNQLFEELKDLDLVYIAQLVSEQNVSIVPQLVDAAKLATRHPTSDNAVASTILPLFEHVLNGILPAASNCDLAKLALPREPARPMPSNSGKGPHPVQRQHQRSDSTQQGPDYCPIPPPYIRVQRYGDTVEMLPPALHFWGTLGLSPANGTKDVRVVSIVPGNVDLVHLMQDFLNELRLSYEANKLGSWKPVSGMNVDSEELTLHDESTVLVHPPSDEEAIDAPEILQAYALACENLGKALASIGHEDADRTVLVCIINPFTTPRAQQALCACFWMLYKAYRDSSPKAQRNAQRSDIVLRILPVAILASPDGLVILEQQQFAQLAMEIYDRCPPSGKATATKDVPAALMPYFVAPAVELSLPIPRRIPFQLSADPPGDLLYENSALHLAYTIGVDRRWMCFSWIDGSGRYANQMSICLSGKKVSDVISEAWGRTGEWLRARDVTWRVYIVGCGGGAEGEQSVKDCWRSVVGTKARRQPLHVSLLGVDLDPELELTPPLSAPQAQEKTGQGFLTPVTTPSGTTMTVSPDATAAAPPTPASSDPAPDTDAEAHIVEVADESWGLMLSPAFASSASSDPLASGMLFRRGSSGPSGLPDSDSARLEALAVSLHWDIRVRPNGTVDEGPARQAEFTLREVLRAYRNFAVLGRARSLSGSGDGRGVVPVHVDLVLRGARAVEGMLG